MSSLYNLEPQPTGKVVLHTTSGDIELELFAQQTPLTARNFLQHCLDGYYDGTIFHRLVPGFIIQGGDPTGTGHGGQSSHEGGAPFEDEFHSRLRFNRRGLLGMANSGSKDDNTSQFFLTLDKADELTGRNTMFGRIEGNTIYNLVKMSETELTEEEGSDKPMYPTKITGTEILVNPFADMVKRQKLAERTIEHRPAPKKKAKKKAGKNILSFGGDDDDGEGDASLESRPKFNPMLINTLPDTSVPRPSRPAPEARDEAPRPAKRRKTPSHSPIPEPAQHLPPPTRPKPDPINLDDVDELPLPPSKPDPLALANAQIASLKDSLRRTVPTANQDNLPKMSALDSMMPSTATRGRKRRPGGSAGPSADEQRALAEFNAFAKRLEKAQVTSRNASGRTDPTIDLTPSVQPAPDVADANDDEALLCDLHFIANCQSCRAWEDDDGGAPDDDDFQGLMTHRLTFAKDRLGKDLEWKRQNEDSLVVIDPRERAREFRAEEKAGKEARSERKKQRR